MEHEWQLSWDFLDQLITEFLQRFLICMDFSVTLYVEK